MKKIGITGQNGFIGKSLYDFIKNCKEEFKIIEFERHFFDDSALSFVSDCDVIVHLAALNRHESQDYIYKTNITLVKKLIDACESTSSTPHIIFSSSSQEARDDKYGNSKQEGRLLFSNWASKNESCFTGLIIPNVFGPNVKPYYNSVVATFSYQLLNGEQPTVINDSEISLIYIDDLIDQIISVIRIENCDHKKIIPEKFKIRVTEILKKLTEILENKNQDHIDNSIENYLSKTLKSYKMHKKKVVILGSSGMAGHVIFKYLEDSSDYQIFNVSYRNKINADTTILDVSDFEKLKIYLENINPDYVINAVGVLVKDAQDNPSRAILLNSYLPHYLVKLSNNINYRLIHLSTDCVFSGSKGGYVESSFKDADDMYGRTKALGEIQDSKNLTLRTSIVGPEVKDNGSGLLHWFLNNELEISGYKYAYWSGVTTLELAKIVKEAIDRDIVGLRHITNNEKISKYDLLLLLKKVWEKDFQILENNDYKIDKSFLDTKKDLKRQVPSYKVMIEELKQFMIKNDTLFNYSQRYKI